MATISELLNKIRTAIYGKDVRSAIADAIKKCYDDAQTGSVTIPDGSITADKLANGAVTQDKIAAKAVSNGKLDDGAAVIEVLYDGAVVQDIQGRSNFADISTVVQTGISDSSTTNDKFPATIGAIKTYLRNNIFGSLSNYGYGAAEISINGNSAKVPILDESGVSGGVISPERMPLATSESAGAISATDKVKLDSLELVNTWWGSLSDGYDEGDGEGYDSSVGGYARTVTTKTGNFELKKGSSLIIDNTSFYGDHKHYIDVDGNGYKEIEMGGYSFETGKYELISIGLLELVYDGSAFQIVNGYTTKAAIETVPIASYTTFGKVKALVNGDPPGGWLKLTFYASPNGAETDQYVPFISNGGAGTIRAKFLPLATASTQGAMSAADKAKLDKLVLNQDGTVTWSE